jgi:hypothetical protein
MVQKGRMVSPDSPAVQKSVAGVRLKGTKMQRPEAKVPGSGKTENLLTQKPQTMQKIRNRHPKNRFSLLRPLRLLCAPCVLLGCSLTP